MVREMKQMRERKEKRKEGTGIGKDQGKLMENWKTNEKSNNIPTFKNSVSTNGTIHSSSSVHRTGFTGNIVGSTVESFE